MLLNRLLSNDVIDVLPCVPYIHIVDYWTRWRIMTK